MNIPSKLDELELLIKQIITITGDVKNDVHSFASEQAPVIVYQRLCSELVRVMIANPGKAPNEVTEAMEILTSTEVLQRIYPELKK